MGKTKARGFAYHLSKEAMEKYHEKPLDLRLKWLYMGNLLRKGCGKEVIKLQDKFREGKM